MKTFTMSFEETKPAPCSCGVRLKYQATPEEAAPLHAPDCSWRKSYVKWDTNQKLLWKAIKAAAPTSEPS